MPTFCRHNRLVQNCPICSREQDVAMRPVVSPGGQATRPVRASGGSGGGSAATSPARSRSGSGRSASRGSGVVVRRLARGADDGYRSGLVPGLRSGADAGRLADELAFATTRLARLAADPPGLYAEVADASAAVEERTWLAFLIAYLSPLEGDDPFAGIAAVRTSWDDAEQISLDGVATGPRSAHDPARGRRTIDAYRAWAQRSGSQEAAISGDPSWTPERRFSRAFERMALPGFDRGARIDLLATLGRLGVYELRAERLGFGSGDPVTLAAKRSLGIGDPMLLERRAADLADACAIPLEALDAGFFNWERGTRAQLGMPASEEPDGAVLERVRAALGL